MHSKWNTSQHEYRETALIERVRVGRMATGEHSQGLLQQVNPPVIRNGPTVILYLFVFCHFEVNLGLPLRRVNDH